MADDRAENSKDQQFALSTLTTLLHREALENDRFFVRGGIALAINLALLAGIVSLATKPSLVSSAYSILISCFGVAVCYAWHNISSFGIRSREFRERDCRQFILDQGWVHIFRAEMDIGRMYKPTPFGPEFMPTWKHSLRGNMASSYIVHLAKVFGGVWVAIFFLNVYTVCAGGPLPSDTCGPAGRFEFVSSNNRFPQ